MPKHNSTAAQLAKYLLYGNVYLKFAKPIDEFNFSFFKCVISSQKVTKSHLNALPMQPCVHPKVFDMLTCVARQKIAGSPRVYKRKFQVLLQSNQKAHNYASQFPLVQYDSRLNCFQHCKQIPSIVVVSDNQDLLNTFSFHSTLTYSVILHNKYLQFFNGLKMCKMKKEGGGSYNL